MKYSVTFDEMRQARKVRVKCPECGKSRELSVSRSYCRNGFHDERETRAKQWQEILAECEQLERDGRICQACEDAANNEPIIDKLVVTNDKRQKVYTVRDRATKTVIGKIIKHRWGGTPWEPQYPNEKVSTRWRPYSCDSRSKAAIALKKEWAASHSEGSDTP